MIEIKYGSLLITPGACETIIILFNQKRQLMKVIANKTNYLLCTHYRNVKIYICTDTFI